MLYTVKYRKVGSFFWTTVKKVKGDSVGNREEFGYPVRVLILENDRRLEISANDTEFLFSEDRHKLILSNMEKNSGQRLS